MRTTNAILTEAQEVVLKDYLRQRLATLRVDNNERMVADNQSWLTYENDADRRAGEKGTIFEKSNVHLPITAMIVDYFLGRSEDNFPEDGEAFFDFVPVGAKDRPKADQFNHYFNWKIDNKGGASSTLREGLTHIYVQRAAIFKSVLQKDTKKWIDHDRRILVDVTTGQPVLTVGGGPVIEGEDKWVTMPDPVSEQVSQAVAETGVEPPPVENRTHLESDPTVIWDANKHQWQKAPGGLKREETLYAGPKSVIVDYDRFLCPAMAESIESADCIAELYDKNNHWYESMWLDRPWERWKDFKGELDNGTASAKTLGENQSKEQLGFDDKNTVRKVVEFWLRRDVMGWGEPQDLVVFYDEEADKLIFYEFVAKVCPDFKRPYTAIAIGKTKKRWWGKSMPEKVAQYQEKIDRNFNAEAYRNEMNANPLKGVDISATQEEEEDLVFSPDKIYNMKAGKTMENFVSFATLPDHDNKTRDIAEFVLWLVQRWLHMSNSNMGELAQSQGGEAETATGAEINQDETATMSRRWDRRINSGYREHIKKLVQIAAATLPENQSETFEFMEGEDTLTDTMTGKDIAGIDINVSLVINKKFNTQKRRSAEQCLAIVQAYIALPPDVRVILRPAYVEILDTIGYRNDKELLPITDVLPPPEEPKPVAQGGSA